MLPRVSTRNSDLALYDVSLSQSRARDESDNASDVQQRGRPVGRVADRQCALADTYYKSRKSLRHRVVGHPHYIGISPASRGDLNRWTPDAASARSRSARWLLTPVLRCRHISARRVLLISGRARRRRRRRHYRRHRRQRNPQAHAHLFAAPSCLRKLLGWVKARRRKMDGENSLIHDSLSLSLFLSLCLFFVTPPTVARLHCRKDRAFPIKCAERQNVKDAATRLFSARTHRFVANRAQ